MSMPAEMPTEARAPPPWTNLPFLRTAREVEELGSIGPWEVLAWWTSARPGDGWAVTALSQHGGPVTCADGLNEPQHADVPDAVVHGASRSASARR